MLALDDEVDDNLKGNYQAAQEKMRASPDQIASLTGFLSVSRNLERIADHATNIAEDVIYVASGEIVRHGHDMAD